MLQRQLKHYTPEEYLSLEDQADYRSEYYGGKIFAMAGASRPHNLIAGNLYAALNQFLRAKPCEAYISDMKLLIKKHQLYTYPDIMVVCGRPKFAPGRNDTITNPVVIVEVLSKSTQQYDQGEKFEFYKAIDTFRDYVLVAQHQMHVEQFQKQADGLWLHTELEDPQATLSLTSLGFEIVVGDIYHKVDWSRPLQLVA